MSQDFFLVGQEFKLSATIFRPFLPSALDSHSAGCNVYWTLCANLLGCEPINELIELPSFKQVSQSLDPKELGRVGMIM